MATPITIKHPDYFLSVGNVYYAKRDKDLDGTYTYGTTEGTESIKSVGVSITSDTQEVWASGILYEYVQQKSNAQLTVDALQLPPEWVDEMLGVQTHETNTALTYETVKDQGGEFAFGVVFEYASGKKVYKWFPRCKLTENNFTVQTRESGTPNPQQRSYTVVAFPVKDMLVATYDQSKVAEGEMLTEDEFFAAVIFEVGQDVAPTV